MREKRPRISNYKNQLDRKEEHVFDDRLDNNTEMYEGKSLFKGELPDIEIDEHWEKGKYEQSRMSDYQIESDLKQNDESKDWQIDTQYTISFIKDIYNTIDFDHSI